MLSASSEFCCDWTYERTVIGSLNCSISWRTMMATLVQFVPELRKGLPVRLAAGKKISYCP